jgi:hypothetical protein
MVYADWGKVLSVSDGMWVILYSARGIVGFVAFFMYLLSPLFLLRKRLGRVAARDEQMMLAGLAVLLAVCAVDLLPNGLYTSVPFLIAGMLYGATRTLSSQAPTTSPEAIPVVRRVE